MKAVILAAGAGKRLRPLTNQLPKALIEIGRKPILHYSLSSLVQNGIKEAVVVTGFCSELIKSRIGNDYRGVKIEYVENQSYARTGSMYSFSMARDFIDSDIILLESDLLYEPRAIGELLSETRFKDCFLVSGLSDSGDEVYICTDGKSRITSLGKDISPQEKRTALGEITGISKFSKKFLKAVFEDAENDYGEGKKGRHYEERIFKTSVQSRPVYALFSKGLLWIEIDDKKALMRAKNHIFPKIKKYFR